MLSETIIAAGQLFRFNGAKVRLFCESANFFTVFLFAKCFYRLLTLFFTYTTRIKYAMSVYTGNERNHLEDTGYTCFHNGYAGLFEKKTYLCKKIQQLVTHKTNTYT